MGLTTRPIVNFSGGEASKRLGGRIDAVQYYSVAKKIENFIVTNFGGLLRRPGFRFVNRQKKQNKNARMVEFIFSSDQSYALEFGDLYIRFFTDNGSIVESPKTIYGATQANPVVILSTAHNFSNGDFVDIINVAGMTQLNGKRYKVAGKTTDNFSLTDEDDNNIDGTAFGTYTNAGTAERVYELVSPYLEADLPGLRFAQEGDVLYIAHPSYPPMKLSRYGDANWTLAEVDFTWGPFLPENLTATTLTPSGTTGSNITLTASTSLFEATHEGSLWKIKTGYVRFKTYSNATTAIVDIIEALADTGATDEWSEGAWSDKRGYPKDVKFFERRLFFVSTSYKPLNVWGSVPEQYENFQEGSEDDDSIIYKIGAPEAITWIYPTSVLNLGTMSGPFTMSADGPLTPTNVLVRQQNEDGASTVPPVRIGSFIYYPERNGKILGQLSYAIATDSFDTKNITSLSDHILGDGVAYMALQKYPFRVLWCVRTDGVLATMTRDIEQNITGWARQITDGEVESVCVIPNGVEDQVWITVKRTIDGVDYRFVEYLEAFDFGDQEDAFFLDSGLTYDGAATATLTGLDHLEGEVVQIITDGAVHPDRIVTNGQVTLAWETSKAHVGLAYDSEAETMDLEGGSASGTAQGRPKHVGRVMARFIESLGGKIGDGVNFETIVSNKKYMDVAPALVTGDKEVSFPSGHEKNKSIVIKQTQPLPMHIIGIFPSVMVAD